MFDREPDIGSRLSKAIGKKTIKQNIESAPANAYRYIDLDDIFFEKNCLSKKNINQLTKKIDISKCNF